MTLQQMWQSSPGQGSRDLMTFLCGGQRTQTAWTGREPRSPSPPRSTAKWGVWQTAQTHTAACFNCRTKCLTKALLLLHSWFYRPSATNGLSEGSSCWTTSLSPRSVCWTRPTVRSHLIHPLPHQLQWLQPSNVRSADQSRLHNILEHH